MIDGKSAVNNTLENKLTVTCPLCDQEYRMGYSDSEWNRVKDWLTIAERDVRQDHKRKHQAQSLHLEASSAETVTQKLDVQFAEIQPSS